MNLTVRQARKALAGSLVKKSSLYQLGDLSHPINYDDFILRVNTLFGRSQEADHPKDEAASILGNGSLKDIAELVAFGRWVEIATIPVILSQRGGVAIDPRRVLLTVAVARAVIRQRARAALARTKKVKPVIAPITATDLSHCWDTHFNEPIKPSDSSSNIDSAIRVLNSHFEEIGRSSSNSAARR